MIDDLIGNAEAFPVLREWNYFNHAGMSPLPAVVAQAVAGYAKHAAANAYLNETWFPKIDEVRRLAARLINADADELALMTNTSVGIATVARGLSWSAGQRIVTAAVEYPANLYPWLDIERKFGVEVIRVPERRQPDGTVTVDEGELIKAAEHPRTRLLSVSHVQWASGQRTDLRRLGTFCRDRGILFGVDAIQTAGVVPIDVQADFIDFLWSGSHKWLLAPAGGGMFYIRKEHFDVVEPSAVGWKNFVNPMDWGTIDFTYLPNAQRYEPGTPPIATLLGMHAALTLLLDVGVERIHERVTALGDVIVQGARRRGWRVVSPRPAGRCGGAVCLEHDTHKPQAVLDALRASHKVEGAAREGRLRLAPHFYNTQQQLEQVVDALPA